MKEVFIKLLLVTLLLVVFSFVYSTEIHAAVASYQPDEVTMEYGTVYTGTVSDLYYDDESLFVTKSTTTQTYKLAWWVSWDIHVTKSSVTRMTLTYKGKSSTDAANDEYISLYNFTKNTWDVVIQRPVLTEAVTSVWRSSNATDLQDYISPDGQVRSRIYNSARSSVGTYYRYGDYFNLEIEYTASNPRITLTPEMVNMEYGTIASGTPYDMSSEDENYFVVNADSTYKSAWWTSWTTGLDSKTVTAMTVTYQGKWSTVTNALWLSFWNWDTGKWQVVLTAPSAVTNKKWIWTGSDWDKIQHFISASGEVRCRVYNSAPSGAGGFQRYTDSLEVSFEYGANRAFTFATIADVHHPGGVNYQQLVQVINDINNNPEIAFVINNGDTASYSKEEEFNGYLYDIAALHAPIYESPGNHDVRWYCGNGLDNFRMKMNQQGYIMFDYEGTRMIVLDTSVFMENDGAMEPYLLTWVENSLSSLSTDIPILLFGHHPELNVPLRRELLAILADYNVKVFLGGHQHTWGHSVDNGVTWAAVDDVKGNSAYALVSVTPTHIKVRKRDAATKITREWLSIPRKKTLRNRLTMGSLAVNQSTGNVTVTVEAEPSFREIVKVEARVRGYANFVEFQKTSPLLWTGTIDVSFYQPSLPKGKHFVEIVATDIDGDSWTLYEEYIWTSTEVTSLWEFASGGSIQSPPTFFNDRVYVGTNNGNIYAINIGTGEESWCFPTGGEVVSTPAIYNNQEQNLVIVGSADRKLYALHAETGSLVWSYTTGGAVLSSPLVHGDKVYFGSGDKKVYCLDAINGNFNWSYQTEGLMRQRPVIYNDVLYTVIRDMKLWYAININDGSLKWLTNADTGNSWMPVCDNSPVVTNDQVWVVKPDYTFSTLHAETGAITWTHPGSDQFSARGAVAYGGIVFNASRKDIVFAWDSKNKSVLWQVDLKQAENDIQYKGVNSGLVAENGKIYRISARGRVNCLKADTGEIIWEYAISGLPEINFWSTPHVYGSYFFAGGLDGKLYALQIPE